MKINSTFLLGFAAAVVLSSGQTSYAFAKPVLNLTCALPNASHLVTCRLTGHGFRAHEGLAITYRVTFLALPRENGKYQERVFHRAGVSDAQGAFRRPLIGFKVVPRHESYRITATVKGSAGDSATITFAAIAQ